MPAATEASQLLGLDVPGSGPSGRRRHGTGHSLLAGQRWDSDGTGDGTDDGTAVGQRWDRRWDSGEAAMEQRWDRYGTAVGQRWNRRWDSDGIAMR